MVKATANKPSHERHNKKRLDASREAIKSSHSGFSNPHAQVIQSKPVCPCGGGCPRCTSIQAKLKIGKPNDKYEQEADRVADEMMCMPEPGIRRKPT